MKKLILVMWVLGTTMFSCYTPEPGCTDDKALNYDFVAEAEDGSCYYSDVIFYGSQFSPCPPVNVQVNGSTIGTITAAYPGGPGNCSVPGAVRYTFQSSDKIDWIATDACGFIFSGSLSPNRVSDCIKVRVF